MLMRAEVVDQPAAQPVTFADTVGLFQPTGALHSDAAVLFVSPFGLEDMCLRKLWRITAERIAVIGLPSLRFDHPGTGDALDGPPGFVDLDLWGKTIVAAADALCSLSRCMRIILVGHGLGATLALRMAGRMDAVDAVACLAPVTSGRAYLRELQIWSRMVDEGLGLAEAYRITDRPAIAGHILPQGVAADLKTLTLAEASLPSLSQAFVAARPERAAEAGIADALATLGASVTRTVYVGYDAFVANPAISRLPEALVDDLALWLSAFAQEKTGAKSLVSAEPASCFLAGADFSERPITFGSGLQGAFCQPTKPGSSAAVLLLGTAYDRHAGWGRSSVTLARDLAAAGIASLRFDGASVADSPPRPGAPKQVLYDDHQLIDVSEALDALGTLHDGPVIVAGRCSGAYLAFRSAVAEQRIDGLIAVNPYVFEWDPTLDVDAALQGAPRSLDDYGSRLLQGGTFKRLLRGEVDIAAALKNIVLAIAGRIWRLSLPLVGRLPGVAPRRRSILNAFRTLGARNVSVDLIYSEGDVGFEHFASLFGADGRRLRSFGDMRLTILAGADHNLSPAFARDAYRDALIDLAARVSAKSQAVVQEKP
ncbi:alpha/beta hydrolase [Rhizobium sp. AAP43]|uniref:alpha/beta fold hydrolase n=1 Tax=Rhizobium sp. AAP43 TaxID=1523420 RepID=UPI0006B885C3|nr:alpha/beta hydrolase [Rhizobium sp. AAP43]KPF41200.1 hypothetical protein IP76_22120 [Rhizobium sp. AAP43]